MDEVVFPIVKLDMPDADDDAVRAHAYELLDRNVSWVHDHIFEKALAVRIAHRAEADQERLRKREERAGDALSALRLALRKFNHVAESLRAGRQKDREAGLFEQGTYEGAVDTVQFFTGRLVDGPSIPFAAHAVHWAAAQHALAKYKDALEPRALLVLDIDRPGLLGDGRGPHLPLRHLAMLSVLAGNWPNLSDATSPHEIMKAERNSLNAQLKTFGLQDRPRAERPDDRRPLRSRPARAKPGSRAGRAPRI